MRERALLNLNEYKLTRFSLYLLHQILEFLTMRFLKFIPGTKSIYSMRQKSARKLYGMTDLDLALVIQAPKLNDPFTRFKKYSIYLKLIKFFFKLIDRNGTILISHEDFKFMEEFNLGFYWSEELAMNDWELLWGEELRIGKITEKTKIGPDTVWRIQSLYLNLHQPHIRKIIKQIEKTNQLTGTSIQPTPYGLYQALEKWSGGIEKPDLNKLIILDENPLSITDDQYFVIPSNLSEEAFSLIYKEWHELSAISQKRIFFMGNKFFTQFLNHFSHYVAYEPYLLSRQLKTMPELNSNFWRSLIQDVMIEKNERLLRDVQKDRYEKNYFYLSKHTKLNTYLYLIMYQSLPEKSQTAPICTSAKERFTVINNLINQCLNHLKNKKNETL